jgi:hypothetical protein
MLRATTEERVIMPNLPLHPLGPATHAAPWIAALTTADGTRVLVPERVDLQLPRETSEEIVVPASINGRDLSVGKP